MTSTETPVIAQVEQLLAERGYEVTSGGGEVLRVRDLDTGISFQVALEGNVLYMSVTLETISPDRLTPELMRTMLAGDNSISTSSFQLYDTPEGKVAVTLSNFCTLQNMGPEDQDDVLSSAGYLMADLLAARDLIGDSALATGSIPGKR